MILKISILSIVIFILLTLGSAKIETPFDGNDTIGFPLTFYFQNSGECDPCPANPIQVYYFYLLIDIITATIISALIWKLWLKIKSKSEPNS